MAYTSTAGTPHVSAVHVTLRLPILAWEQAKQIAKERGLSLNATILALIDLGFRQLREEVVS